MAKTPKATPLTPPTRLRDEAQHPVSVTRLAHPDVWKAALAYAEGDVRKIRIISPTEVEVMN